MEILNICKPCKCGNYSPCIKNGDCRFCYTNYTLRTNVK